MSLLPVAVWGLTVSTEDGIVSAIPEIPAIVSFTLLEDIYIIGYMIKEN